MARALALALFPLLASLAFAQVSCDAQEVVFDFSSPGPLTVQGGYPVANLAGYLHIFDTGPSLFLPTRVVGGVGYRVQCTVTTGKKGGKGTACGADQTYCFRIESLSQAPSFPLDPYTRLYAMVQTVSGAGVTVHVPSPTPLASIPDRMGLASVPRNTTAILDIYLFLYLSPEDTFATLPTSGWITVTYRLDRD
ncbi:hypothetical protein [Thermus albus]|uniref:hypothetical protein n=1 Tax=Thermus albus TaxID=2908146 RepID=UPI001FAAF5DE|nr:hypothetical protein [Thermus albus]